jgi:copper chaperone
MCSTTASPSDLGLTDKNHACSCGTGGHSHDTSANPDSTSTGNLVREQFTVTGMTCTHCVSSVTEEVTAIDGVESVSVDLNVGGPSTVMVVSRTPIATEDVRAAVTEAGYELVTA